MLARVLSRLSAGLTCDARSLASQDGLYSILLTWGSLVASPLFMSIGSMLVLPTSITVDKLLHSECTRGAEVVRAWLV